MQQVSDFDGLQAKKMSGTAWKGGFLILIHAGVNLFACPVCKFTYFCGFFSKNR